MDNQNSAPPTQYQYQMPPPGDNQQQQPQQMVMQPQQPMMAPGQQPMMMAPGQQQMMMAPGQQPMMMAPGQQQMMMAPGQQQMMMAPGQQQMMMTPEQQQMMAQQQRNMTPQQQQQMMMMMAAQQQQMQRPVMWMSKPGAIAGCPPGLEYLSQLDQLLVKQQIEIMEILTNFEMCNKYVVRNVLGQQVYFAREESDACMRQCCGPQRSFTLHIEDNMGQEVIQIIRPYKCMCYGQCCSCAEMCQDEVEVQAPPGETVGFVKQLYENCNISYAVQDVNRQMVLRLDGPSYFHCHCPGDDVPFQLNSADGSSEVGKISKQWSNLMREYFTDADNFGIQFPMDLDVRMKAVVLGAVFLIDFMFFERQQNRRRN